MTVKKSKMMMMKMSMIMAMILMASKTYTTFEMKKMFVMDELIELFNYSTMKSLSSMIFMIMVMTVTTMVLKYSEIYMEWYSMKKFLTNLMAFFLSMLIMSSSMSMMNLMIGWETLGISSLCLIMFYPNKTSKMNSMMTMMFNRMGDILMILILSMMMMEMKMNFFNMEIQKINLMMILICSLTKSAQFPMSVWLPAAMSAPTPISAMVHSSTLVTAGIFLMNKFLNEMMMKNILIIMVYLSMLSFLIGSMLANIEMDLKKMIAFSTMSQISMIMMFLSMSFFLISMTHMMFHAMFKTMLFCSAGIIFMNYWSVQINTKLSSKSFKEKINFILILSIYSMSGLIFSLSFFTKDLFIELIMFNYKKSLIILFLILSMFLTIFYSMKMMSFLLKTLKKNNYSLKYTMSLIFIFMTLLTLTLQTLIETKNMIMSNAMISWKEVMMLNMMMMIPMFISIKTLNSKMLFKSSLEVYFMKFFMFEMYAKYMNNTKMMKLINSDILFMKMKYNLNMKNFEFLNKNSTAMIMFLLLILKLL